MDYENQNIFVENSNNPKILVAMIYSCEHLRNINITSIQKTTLFMNVMFLARIIK